MTLKAALKKRNMSALELIHRSELSEQTIYNITSPNKEPYKTGVKTETLAKIARVLNATIVINESKPFMFDIELRRTNENFERNGAVHARSGRGNCGSWMR